jgi:hypothetical protein
MNSLISRFEREWAAASATYAIILALLATAAILWTPGAGVKLFVAIAERAGGCVARWFS